MPRATLGEMVAMAIVGCLGFRGWHRHSTYMTAICALVLSMCALVFCMYAETTPKGLSSQKFTAA
jgi:sugar phosphate permease